MGQHVRKWSSLKLITTYQPGPETSTTPHPSACPHFSMPPITPASLTSQTPSSTILYQLSRAFTSLTLYCSAKNLYPGCYKSAYDPFPGLGVRDSGFSPRMRLSDVR